MIETLILLVTLLENKLKHYCEDFDKISSYNGVSAFFNEYAKIDGYENILETNDWLLLKIIIKEFNSISDTNKKVLIYSEENEFFKFMLKIRTLMHIFRDISTKLQIKQFDNIFVHIIKFIIDLFESNKDFILRFATEEEKLDEFTISPFQAKFIKIITSILGEVLAKNLVDRKKMLEFIFKLIELEQPDEILREIGRDWIDIALQFAEDDDSIDFFKFLPWFIIPVLKNSSRNRQFSILMARIFKLLPLNKVGAFDHEKNDSFNPSKEYEQGFEFLKVIWNKKSSFKDEILKSLNVQESIREYQEEGISWIVSLTDFGFNWALWDDMGLGKTFQALAAVAIKVKERKAIHGSK